MNSDEARMLAVGPFDDDWYIKWQRFTEENDPVEYVDAFVVWEWQNPLGGGRQRPLLARMFDSEKKRDKFEKALRAAYRNQNMPSF